LGSFCLQRTVRKGGERKEMCKGIRGMKRAGEKDEEKR
jgi:hypothetical protein